jgi:hypothetical protein
MGGQHDPSGIGHAIDPTNSVADALQKPITFVIGFKG